MNNKAGNLTFTRGTGDLADVVYLKLDRPDKLNGLTLNMLQALVNQSKQIAGDRSIRAVIIHGEGQNFSAG